MLPDESDLLDLHEALEHEIPSAGIARQLPLDDLDSLFHAQKIGGIPVPEALGPFLPSALLRRPFAFLPEGWVRIVPDDRFREVLRLCGCLREKGVHGLGFHDLRLDELLLDLLDLAAYPDEFPVQPSVFPVLLGNLVLQPVILGGKLPVLLLQVVGGLRLLPGGLLHFEHLGVHAVEVGLGIQEIIGYFFVPAFQELILLLEDSESLQRGLVGDFFFFVHAYI